jgi:rRNA maturation endonuclease Nob1
MNANTVAMIAMTMMSHQACTNSDRPMTICVKAGSSAPKPANTCSNCGTTLISRMPLTTMATTMTAIG